MDNHFGFLAQAKPSGLFRLLEKLPMEDLAIALAGLPTAVGVQVMAFFPETVQSDLMPAMREARRVSPERAGKTAAKIRDLLVKAKYARDGQTDGAPETAARTPKAEPPPPPPARQTAVERKPPNRPDDSGKPTPWVPRTATQSPINGPALPGTPPPVAGDPLKSPLAKSGFMDLLGRVQEKFLPKTGSGRTHSEATRQGKTPPAGKRPAPREGVARSVPVTGKPRVLGPAGATPAGGHETAPAGKARHVDGKAILAAILREADPKVRNTVRHQDPALFQELRGRMFYFDDLTLSDDGALARVFTTAPTGDAALALKFAAPALRDRVLRVVSPGRARALQDADIRPSGLDSVEAAQQKVLDVALRLQAAGRILIDPRDPDLAE